LSKIIAIKKIKDFQEWTKYCAIHPDFNVKTKPPYKFLNGAAENIIFIVFPPGRLKDEKDSYCVVKFIFMNYTVDKDFIKPLEDNDCKGLEEVSNIYSESEVLAYDLVSNRVVFDLTKKEETKGSFSIFPYSKGDKSLMVDCDGDLFYAFKNNNFDNYFFLLSYCENLIGNGVERKDNEFTIKLICRLFGLKSPDPYYIAKMSLTGFGESPEGLAIYNEFIKTFKKKEKTVKLSEILAGGLPANLAGFKVDNNIRVDGIKEVSIDNDKFRVILNKDFDTISGSITERLKPGVFLLEEGENKMTLQRNFL
jgi:hypothetical protein